MTLYTRRQALAACAVASGFSRLNAATLSQVRLGITTDEIDEDVAAAARFLHGIRHLHFAEIRSIWGEYNTSQPVSKIEEARKLLDAQGVRTSVLGTAFFKIPLPPETAQGRGILDSQWAVLDQAMERARILGTDKIRVFAFTYKDKSQKSNARDFSRILDLVREASRRAKARNFRVGFGERRRQLRFDWRGFGASAEGDSGFLARNDVGSE